MKRIKSFGIIFIIECALILSYHASKIDLQEDCTKKANHVCKLPGNCTTLARNFVRNSLKCAPIGNQQAVCCPPKAIKIQTKNPLKSITQPQVVYTADKMCEKYSEMALKVSKETGLGCASVSKIIGGSLAQPMEFPHMVLLGSGKNWTKNSVNWNCGGSLISDRWILTAAHCVYDINPKIPLWARMGSVQKYIDDKNTQYYQIKKVVIHSGYSSDVLYNDIALLRTTVKVKFTPYVRPICVNADKSLNFESATVSGWGRTTKDSDANDDLSKVNVDYIPNDKCRKLYPEDYDITYGIQEDKMVCAGDLVKGNDTCMGDSGGPLQVRHKNYTCMLTEIGITSFGKSCGSRNGGVYTRVSKYVKWIEKIVWTKLM